MLKNKKGMKILICTYLIATLGFFNPIPADYVKNIDDINIQNMVQTVNETNIIDELTWSVLRYQGDLTTLPCNFGTIHMPKPSPGTIVIPINLICGYFFARYMDDPPTPHPASKIVLFSSANASKSRSLPAK